MTSVPPGFMVDPDGGERLSFAGADFVVRASADTTGGAFSKGFFRELAEAERDGSIGRAAYADVSRRYGITWLDR